ncbi:hypothetical protein RQP46_009926 [Phenoliferia psychrophenolica]
MVRKWGAGLLATTQWGLEGKIGDCKRKIKSRTLPVKNMEKNNVDSNIMTLARLKFDFPTFTPTPNPKLRLQHTSLPSTTLLHTKIERPVILEKEAVAIRNYLGGLGLSISQTEGPTRWQRVELSNGEIVGSMMREPGTELNRIISENDAVDDMERAEREGNRRATRFAKVRLSPLVHAPPLMLLFPQYTLKPAVGVVNNDRSHGIFEVDSYMSIPVEPDNRPHFIALGRTFLPPTDRYRLHEVVPIGESEDRRHHCAIG